MNQLGGRRDRRGGVRAGGRPLQRVGQPNVLSDAAIPNVLSTQPGRQRPLATGRGAQPVPRASSVTASPTGQARLATGQTTGTASAPTRVRLPSFGTVIFLGFIAITAVRLLGQFTSGISAPTEGPTVTSPAAPAQSQTPGAITFGTEQGTDCDVTGAAAAFGPSTDVWWSARLSSVQPADAGAVVIVSRDGVEVGRDFVPPDRSFGQWSVLCAGEPIAFHDPGTYRVDVWNEDETVLHATGEYRVR